MNTLPQNINEVLEYLDQIIEESIQRDNYLAIFAYIYRRTTAQIKSAIDQGAFEDNPRMEAFDVVFANKYIKAYQGWKDGKEVPNSWLGTFHVRNQKLTTLQHLVIGMNAHINFDLGVAAAEIAPQDKINALENDFMKVNDILAGLIDEMQKKISQTSRMMFLLDWVGGKSDEKIIEFGIKSSRHFAWNVAKTVAVLEDPLRQIEIDFVDEQVAKINNAIIHPKGRLLRTTLRIIGYFEEKKIDRIIHSLKL